MRVATDIGGTFTDLVAIDGDGNVITEKSHTTPPHFERGVIDVLKKSGCSPEAIDVFIHGTTTIINALTERKGAKAALITTRGFRDVLEIARCNRPDLFNLVFAKPRPFIPRYLRHEVTERINYKGEILEPLHLEEIANLVGYFQSEGVESIAVCLLHAYANPEHEKQVAEEVKRLWPEVYVTTSTDITSEWREYERTSTVALNAYVMPTANAYLNQLRDQLLDYGLDAKNYVMQSNGGTTTFEHAKETPINLVESGPVAGVYGAAILGEALGEQNIIAFDIGGTTAKCSLIDKGEVKITTNYRIEQTTSSAGYPIMTPVVDIVEIGNGGGSIAWIDEAGSLKVGPQSAGSTPGPVAYGLGGTSPTTTDASLVTGRLSGKHFDYEVNLEHVKSVLSETIAKPLGKSVDDAALDIIRVANANMINALKLISVRRGYDPREFALVAFGGGGPMHSAFLGRELNVKKIIVPKAASVFAAWGMLMTDLRQDYIRTSIATLAPGAGEALSAPWATLVASAEKQFEEEDVPKENMTCTFYADIRYQGQEHTVKVGVPAPPWSDEDLITIADRFHAAHESLYTFKLDGAGIQIVNYHLSATGGLTLPSLDTIPPQVGEIAPSETRQVLYENEGWLITPIYNRGSLGSGAKIQGPTIVEEPTASTVVYPGQVVTVDAHGNLIIEEGNHE